MVHQQMSLLGLSNVFENTDERRPPGSAVE
jgi:hypothetical protein